MHKSASPGPLSAVRVGLPARSAVRLRQRRVDAVHIPPQAVRDVGPYLPQLRRALLHGTAGVVPPRQQEQDKLRSVHGESEALGGVLQGLREFSAKSNLLFRKIIQLTPSDVLLLCIIFSHTCHMCV